MFHVSNKVGKARIGQRVDAICISSFSYANPLISKGSAVLCFPERVVDWLHFERERVLSGKLRGFSWLIIVNTVIDCHYRKCGIM